MSGGTRAPGLRRRGDPAALGDEPGEEVEDLIDMTCFSCAASYYTLDGGSRVESSAVRR